MTGDQRPPPSQEPAVTAPSGWYADPAGGPTLRYWDGSAWRPNPESQPDTSRAFGQDGATNRGTPTIWAAMGGLTAAGLGAATWWVMTLAQVTYPCADEVQDFNRSKGGGQNRTESKALDACIDRECTDEFVHAALDPLWLPWLLLVILAAVAWILYLRHSKRSPGNSANPVLLLFPVLATLGAALLLPIWALIVVVLGCDPDAFR